MTTANPDDALRQILWELRPYLDELVVIGGWVPYIYRRYGGFDTWESEPPFTQEVDILVPREVPRRGREPIPHILRLAGFEPLTTAHPHAVWGKDPEAGEKIEFLTAHTGTATDRSEVAAVEDQEDMGALSLDRLTFVHTHTQTVEIPLGTYDGEPQSAEVSIPLLGAYVTNKALTFPRRRSLSDGTDNPKQAKDILYLRDISAAGREVASHLLEDFRHIGQTSYNDRRELERARNTLELAYGGNWDSAQRQAARMLAEHVGMPQSEAFANTRGHLLDLKEMLEGVLDELP